MSLSLRRRWLEAAMLAVGAGCGAVMVLDEHARWPRQLLAFVATALPVLAAHARGGQTAAKAGK